MTTEQEIRGIADEISALSPALAVRLRALAWRVAERDRTLDELVEESRLITRAWAERKRAAEAKRAG